MSHRWWLVIAIYCNAKRKAPQGLYLYFLEALAKEKDKGQRAKPTSGARAMQAVDFHAGIASAARPRSSGLKSPTTCCSGLKAEGLMRLKAAASPTR